MTSYFPEILRNDVVESGITMHKRIIKSSFPRHDHAVFELEYILDGNAISYIDDKPYSLNPGSLKLCTPLNVEYIKIQSPTLTLLNINFTDAFINPNLLNDLTTGFVVPDADERLISLLQDEIENNKKYSTLYQKNLLNLIFLDLIHKKNINSSHNIDNIDDIAQQVALYINLHYREHLNLKDISNHFFYTRNNLSKLFFNTFNMSITQYICKTRLSEAEKLLLSTDKTTTEICDEVGFSSISTFFRVFKQYKGVSPKEFKRNMKNNK